MFTIDQRSGRVVANRTYATAGYSDFSKIATDASGRVAVGNDKGEIRLYSYVG
jgi:hypothetical protein